MKRRVRTCIYCGDAAGTDDHVPPKALFARPRPSNLITVPCCETCRQTQSLDDEYFRDALVPRQDVAPHPAARPLLAALHRALARGRGAGAPGSFLREFDVVDLYTPGGLFLGTSAVYHPATPRLDAVVTRTLRGLYWREYGERVENTSIWRVYALDALDLSPFSDAHERVERAIAHVLRGTHRAIGGTVFQYWSQRVSNRDPRLATPATLWLFQFFDAVAFLGMTLSRDAIVFHERRQAQGSHDAAQG